MSRGSSPESGPGSRRSARAIGSTSASALARGDANARAGRDVPLALRRLRRRARQRRHGLPGRADDRTPRPHAGHRILCAAHVAAPVSAEAPRKQPAGDRSKEWDAFRNELRALAERTAKTIAWLDLMREVREAERADRLAASSPEADPPPITTAAQIQQRKRELETLPEDWYIDQDNSYASMPTQATIDQACTAAERALSAGILVDSIEADANGGTCVYLRNADYGEVSLWFSNGGRASVLGHGWREALSESWSGQDRGPALLHDDEQRIQLGDDVVAGHPLAVTRHPDERRARVAVRRPVAHAVGRPWPDDVDAVRHLAQEPLSTVRGHVDAERVKKRGARSPPALFMMGPRSSSR